VVVLGRPTVIAENMLASSSTSDLCCLGIMGTIRTRPRLAELARLPGRGTLEADIGARDLAPPPERELPAAHTRMST
jgi:hypothetical protein